jgi:hypothetical protein
MFTYNEQLDANYVAICSGLSWSPAGMSCRTVADYVPLCELSAVYLCQCVKHIIIIF